MALVLLLLPSSMAYNVIVPANEATYPVAPGAQAQNSTSAVNPSNIEHGGLICDTGGSAPGTPNAQIACVDTRHTAGGEYDGDPTTWTNYFNTLAPVNATCGFVGVQSQSRAPSNATFYLDGPRVVNSAQMSTRAMSGLGHYGRMCAAVYLQDAQTGAWDQVLLRNGYAGPWEVLTDTATFPARSITGIMIVVEWNSFVFGNPPGGWMGVNFLDLQVTSATIDLTHPADGATYEANTGNGYSTVATAETSGAWDRVEFRFDSPTGPLLATASSSPWQAELTFPTGPTTLCAVAVDAHGGSLSSCNAFTVASTAPSAPGSLQAQTGGDPSTIDLSWTAATPVPGQTVSQYRVYRSQASGGPYTPIGSSTGLTYTDDGLTTGTYHYVVRAVNAGNNEGPASNEANATATGATTLVDNFSASNYRPESPTGNTPFGGHALKPPFPAARGARPTVDLANGELVAAFPLLHVDEHVGDDFDFDITFRSIGNADGNKSLSWRWDANWLQHVEPDGTDYILHTGDGRALRFVSATGGWEGPEGSYLKLVPVGSVLELRDREGNRRTFDPSKAHALTDVFDASGNHWALAYDSNGALSAITDPSGRIVTFGYDSDVSVGANPFWAANGQPILTSIMDWAGRTTQLQYDIATGRLVAIKTPGPAVGTSYVTSIEYDADDRIVAIRDPLDDYYVKIDYDAHGRVVAQRGAAGSDAYFQYYHQSGVTFARDGNGNKVEWRFLPDGASTPRVVPSAKIEHTRGLRPTDPANYTTTYTHNAQDELTSLTYPAGNSVAYTYDEAAASFFARGNLLSETRLPGPIQASSLQSTSQSSITTQYAYDPVCNKPTTIVDPRGTDPAFVPPNGGAASAARYTATITYDATCRPLTIQRPTVNPAGAPHPALTSAYANQSITETYTYNAAGQILTYTNPAGVVETRTYHPAPSSAGKPAGYLASVTVDPGVAPHLNLTTTYEYTGFGVVTRVTDPNGNVRAYDVDLRGRTTQETGPAVGSPPQGIRTRWTRDANDQVLSIQRETDPGSGTYVSREWTYDALGRTRTETVHPSAAHAITTQYEYDGNGNLVRRVGGAGEVRTWTYDERSLLLAESGPDGGTYAYDANGNLRTSTDPLGGVTSYSYDGYDRVAVVTNAQQSRFATSYDPAGNVVAERGVGGTSGRILYERTYAHDEANRAYRQREWLQSADTMPLATTGSLGTGGRWVTTLREFDARSLLTRTVDDNGHATTTTYDAAGRLNATTDPTGNVVQSAYDKNGNLGEITRTVANATLPADCPQVCTTQHAYDAENRLVSTTSPDGTMRATEYDGRGNVVKTTDENGNVVLHAYDDADRPTATQRVLATTPATYVTTTTTWDDENRVQSMCDDGGECTNYTYVPATTLVATQTPPTGPSVGTTYDTAGNARSVSYSSGKNVSLGYDSLHRLVSVDLSGGSSASGTTRQRFTYDEMSRLTQATDNGVANLGGSLVTT